MAIPDGLKPYEPCPEVAVATTGGVALCNQGKGHDGPCLPHPSFYDNV